MTLAEARRRMVGSAVAASLFALRLAMLGTVVAVERATGRSPGRPGRPGDRPGAKARRPTPR